MQKKGFTLIELMIVVAIIAILAMIAVPMYQRYIEKSRNAAAQSLLQQLALAEVASQTENIGRNAANDGFVYITQGADTANVSLLALFGFRPDPNVAFYVSPTDNNTTGFVALAANVALGSQVYVYDNINAAGVQIFDSGYDYADSTITGQTSLFAFSYTGNTINVSGSGSSQVVSSVAPEVTLRGTATIDTDTGKVTAFN